MKSRFPLLPLALLGFGLSLCWAQSLPEAGKGDLTMEPEILRSLLPSVSGLQPSLALPSAADVEQGQQRAGELPSLAEQDPEPADDLAAWRSAMLEPCREKGDVALLLLLQKLNPQRPLASAPEDYAEVLQLMHRVLLGDAEAVRCLAQAFRMASFPNGLRFIPDSDAARFFAEPSRSLP